jgi:hypothetical protein
VGFIEGHDRAQVSLLPPSIDDYISTSSLVRVVDAFVDSLDLSELGFERTIAASTGRPAESLYVDYKQATYGGKEADHAELLADVSSFANTAGGDLAIGVAEAGGIPNAIVPFTGNADDERRRLEDIARTGLEPRIRNLQTRAVALADGGAVIIVRVPRSYAPPPSRSSSTAHGRPCDAKPKSIVDFASPGVS